MFHRQSKTAYVAITCAATLLLGAKCVDRRADGAQTKGVVTSIRVRDEIAGTGVVKPQVGSEVKVGPQISGRLKRLHVKVGSMVRAGDVLAELDDSELRYEEEGNASLVRQAEAKLELANATYARRKQLAGTGLISSEELQVAKQEQAVAEAAYRGAVAQRNRSQVRAGYATVRAPISGTVGSIATQEGETVAASLAAPTFVTIVDLTRLQGEVYVDEIDVNRVHVGAQAVIAIDAIPGTTLQAHVESIKPQPEVHDNVVTYPVILRFDDASRVALRPEMTMTANIAGVGEMQVAAVPSNAIVRDNNATYLMVQDDRGVSKRAVVLDRVVGNLVTVRSGVVTGETIVYPEPANR